MTGNGEKLLFETYKETFCTLDNNLASLTALTVSSGCKSPTGISLRHFLEKILAIELRNSVLTSIDIDFNLHQE